MLDELDLALSEEFVVQFLNQLLVGLGLDQGEQVNGVQGGRDLGLLVELADQRQEDLHDFVDVLLEVVFHRLGCQAILQGKVTTVHHLIIVFFLGW